MITLDRLVELRGNKKLYKYLRTCTMHAVGLMNFNPDETIRTLASSNPSLAFGDAKALSDAVALTVYEETRRPFIDFLTELDQAAIVRARPHLHAKLKEMLNE